MRILHIDTGRELRGGQRQALLLITGLREDGHECWLMSREASPLWTEGARAGVATFSLGALELARRSVSVDVVHAHDAHAHTLAAVASRRAFVVSRRVAFPLQRSIFSKWKYSRARRFLAVSQFVAHELQTAAVPTDKIDVVFDGVEPMQIAPGWEPSNPAVALATADPQKGRTLIERAAHIAGVPVIFSADLNRDLMQASMFVYITQSEGLGSAALLAMDMGVPVIASRVGGLSEVFEDRVSGLYVRNHPQEIASAMRSLRENPPLSRTLIEGGKRRIANMFTKRHLIERTLTAYERALAG